MKPGRRDDLITLFDKEFIEGQEQYGMTVIGQFRNLQDPNRFVWLRGFANMEARRRALDGFYNGPIWMQHRGVANDTMLDSSNVLLLRPAGPQSTIRLGNRKRQPSSGSTESVVVATLYYFDSPDQTSFATFFDSTVAPELSKAGATLLGQFATTTQENTFPRLPVRDGEYVFVWLASFPDGTAYQSYKDNLGDSRLWNEAIIPLLRGRVSKSPEVLELAPTNGSLLRHQ